MNTDTSGMTYGTQDSGQGPPSLAMDFLGGRSRRFRLAVAAMLFGIVLLCGSLILFLIFSKNRNVLELPSEPEPRLVTEPDPGPSTTPSWIPPSDEIDSLAALKAYYSGRVHINCGLRSVDAFGKSLVDVGTYAAYPVAISQPWHQDIYRLTTIEVNQYNDRSADFVCSAALVAADWLLTAADCFRQKTDQYDTYWAVSRIHSRDLARQLVELGPGVKVKQLNSQSIKTNDKLALIKLYDKYHPFPLVNSAQQIIVNSLCLPPPIPPNYLQIFLERDHYELVGLLDRREQGSDVHDRDKLIRLLVHERTVTEAKCTSQREDEKLLNMCPLGAQAMCRYGQRGGPLIRRIAPFRDDPYQQSRFYLVGTSSEFIYEPGTDLRDLRTRCDHIQVALFYRIASHASWIASVWRQEDKIKD